MASQGGAQTTSRNEPPEWYSNAAQGYLERQGEISGQEYTPYGGQRIADLSGATRAGIQGLNDLAYGHPMGDDAVDMTRRTLQGGYSNPYAEMQNPYANPNVQTQRNQYAGENPYFNQQLDRGTQKITDAYNRGVGQDTTRAAVMSGAFGGSAHQNQIKNNQEVLGQQLGDYTNSMLSGQYERSAGLEENYLGRDFAGQQFNQSQGANIAENYLNRGANAHEGERGRQMQGVGAATNLLDNHSRNLMNAMQAGDVERTQMQRLLDSQYGDFQEWRNYPQQQNDAYGNALSRSAGGAGSTQTQTGPGADPVSQGMGALALAGMLGRPGGGK